MFKSLLPHLYNGHHCFFITFRLADALPQNVIQELKICYEIEMKKINETDEFKRKLLIDKLKQKYFTKYEHQLDAKPYGDCILKNNTIAQILYDKILSYNNLYYKVNCFSIMPNHIHLMISTLDDNEIVPLDKWLHLIKGGSAFLINKALNRTGKLWATESYDRYIRNDDHFHNSFFYTINNPRAARLHTKFSQKPFMFKSEIE